tara:strand:+ start:788 stop:1144 length:357 start_codon:yes stop_codon:yes gene_type:complete
MSKVEDIQEGDFVIRVRPTEDDGEWTGEIDISIISQADNPLDDESYGQVMHFCKMMCATVPIMEQDETIRNLVHEYVMKVVDNDAGIDVELEKELGVEKEYDGNVVHLTFNSRTGGSA